MDEQPTKRRGPIGCLTSHVRYWQIGFLTGWALPGAYGAYLMYQEFIYRASLPPISGHCGMGMLGAWMMVLIGGPICAVIGATVGLAISLTCRTECEE